MISLATNQNTKKKVVKTFEAFSGFPLFFFELVGNNMILL